MKLINTSNKIINVGKTVLMPGDEMTAPVAMAHLPSIRAMERRGSLRIDDSEERIARAAAEKKQIAADARAEVVARFSKPAEQPAEEPPAEEQPEQPAEPLETPETSGEEVAPPAADSGAPAKRGRKKKAAPETAES